MHEHDGSGCYDCVCAASPANFWPCTCPPEHRLIRKDVEQTPLWNPWGPGQSFGDMTKHRSGQGYIFCLRIDDKFTDMLEDFDFSIGIYPRAALAKFRPNYSNNEDHIIRGED